MDKDIIVSTINKILASGGLPYAYLKDTCYNISPAAVRSLRATEHGLHFCATFGGVRRYMSIHNDAILSIEDKSLWY